MQERREGLAPVTANLGEWLYSQIGKRRVDGEHDCACLVSNWAMVVGYSDPMARFRDTYATEEEAMDIIDEAGGLVALFDGCLCGVGLTTRYGEPQAGDIGVISILDNEAGAIFTGERWAFVVERGIAFLPIKDENIRAVWAIN